MPESETRESRLRSLIIKNANGGLKDENEHKELRSLIDNSIQSAEEYCIKCQKNKENGWDCECEKAIDGSCLCQSHMRHAYVSKQNPYENISK
jgi:hypothetical protein